MLELIAALWWSARVKKRGMWLVGAGAALGMALGVVWSPLAENTDAERSRDAASADHSGHGSNASGRAGGGSRVPSKSSRENSKSMRTAGGGPTELTKESLLEVFKGVESEDEMNIMALIRAASMITQMSEREAIALMHSLALPDGAGGRDIPHLQQILSGIVFTRLCELNGPEAMRMVVDKEFGEDFEEDFIMLGMNSWVEADPKSAAAWFHGLMGQTSALAESGGGEKDMTGMLALVRNQDFMEAAVRGLAKHNSEGLDASIDDIEHPEVRADMEAKVYEAEVKMENTAEGLLALLQKSKDNPKGGDARLTAVEKLVQLDVQKAAEWVEDAPVSRVRDNMIADVANKLLQDNPAAGAEWYMAQELQQENSQSVRAQQIVSRWAARDYVGAEGWLAGQPNDARRDSAEAIIAQQASAQKEWGHAMAWIEDISDDATRDRALKQVFQHGYNQEDKQMNTDLQQAAEAAGFGEAAANYGH